MEVLGVSDRALISRVEKLLAVELAVAQVGQFMRKLHDDDCVSRRDLAQRLARFYGTCSTKQQNTLQYVESVSGIRLDENITVDQSVRFLEALRQCCAPDEDGDIPL